MDKLRENLMELKQLSLLLIDLIEGDDFDRLDEILDSRQEVMNKIDQLAYSKEDFIKISEEYNIPELQKRLNNCFMSKKNHLVEEIKKISTTKNVQNSYGNQPNHDSFFFNKKY